jgi:hypothetical protein
LQWIEVNCDQIRHCQTSENGGTKSERGQSRNNPPGGQDCFP